MTDIKAKLAALRAVSYAWERDFNYDEYLVVADRMGANAVDKGLYKAMYDDLSAQMIGDLDREYHGN